MGNQIDGKKLLEDAKNKANKTKKENTEMKNTSYKETIKTILITVLVTGIIAFIGGVLYQSSNQAQVHAEAVSIVEATKPALKQ